jgi:hypothetical protein
MILIINIDIAKYSPLVGHGRIQNAAAKKKKKKTIYNTWFLSTLGFQKHVRGGARPSDASPFNKAHTSMYIFL